MKINIGFCGFLTIVFIVLRLCEVIEWSWIWVLAPTWIPVSLGVTLLTIAAILEKKA